MSELRPARDDEVRGLWPAVKAARLFSAREEFTSFCAENPWRVRVNESGESVVLAPWRAGGDVLAIRGVWASPPRITALVEQTEAFARDQGYAQLLSPLLSEAVFGWYRSARMRVRERIVAIQGFADEITAGDRQDVVGFRPAGPADFELLERLDAQCFDEFWRYGIAEIDHSHQRERVTLALDADGALVGYATCSLHGASATLGRLAVAPAVRRRGVARALLADAASWAADQQAYALTLCTQRGNAASRRLYASAGLFELPEAYVMGICDL